MTTSHIQAANTNHLHSFWQKLTYELADIFDAHGVCAAVAREVAIFTQTTTIVGVSGPQSNYFDVWVCHKDGRLHQTRWESRKTAFEPFLNTNKAIYQEKFTLPPAQLVNSELWQLPHKAVLAVSLPLSKTSYSVTPPAVLCLVDPASDCVVSLENIEPLALHITTYLDRAYLRHHVHRQDVEFAVVSDISYALTSTLSLQNIFQQLMDPVRRTLNVASISVGLMEYPSNDIIFVDMLLGPLFQNLPPLRLKAGQGIAGWVADNRQPVIINDVYSDKRFYANVDRQSGFQTHSMICIPLQVEERMIGVLQAINKQNGDFNDNDLRLLQAIGGPLAAAIENARLHSDVIAEKRRIETIFASMSEGMLTVDAQGYVTNANDALLILLRKNREALIGQRVGQAIRLKSGSLDEFMKTVFQAEDEYPQLATSLAKDDSEAVPVLISGAPIVSDEAKVNEVIFVFSDLRQILEVERMRDDFFHGIIHELRTPLATILMYARLLREGKAQDKEKADRFLGVIERESDRLQKMVRQMLQVAKMEAREFQRSAEPIHLNPIFDEMLPPMADRALEKGLAFVQRIEPDLPPVMGNQEIFYMVFKNLVDNAIKFTLSGTVRVEVGRKNGAIQVVVKDDGIGIPRQALPNLFGRFFRTQTAVERGIAGTGLGLYMVKEGVEHYNGKIDVNSVEGKGTTFTVQLPVADI